MRRVCSWSTALSSGMWSFVVRYLRSHTLFSSPLFFLSLVMLKLLIFNRCDIFELSLTYCCLCARATGERAANLQQVKDLPQHHHQRYRQYSDEAEGIGRDREGVCAGVLDLGKDGQIRKQRLGAVGDLVAGDRPGVESCIQSVTFPTLLFCISNLHLVVRLRVLALLPLQSHAAVCALIIIRLELRQHSNRAKYAFKCFLPLIVGLGDVADHHAPRVHPAAALGHASRNIGLAVTVL